MRMMSIPMVGLLFALAACGSANQPGATDSSTPAAGEAPAAPGPSAPAEFAVCTGCHSIVAGQTLLGPSLHGVVGRKAGSEPGFAYSAALQKSGIVWTPATLDTWLTAPMTMVPGTKMSFGGYADPKQRAAVIAYLQTLK